MQDDLPVRNENTPPSAFQPLGTVLGAKAAASSDHERPRRHPAELNEAMDVAPLRRLHWKIWGLSAMGIFLDGFDLFVIGVAMPLIIAQWNPSAVMVGAVGAAAVLGAVVGASVGGWLTDRYGRKLIYILDLAAFIVFSIGSALAWDIYALLAFRFLLGVGIGADYPISASYVSEFMPARLRGRMLIGAFSFQGLGMMAAAATGLVILQMDPAPDAWRWMLGIAVIPATIVLVLRLSIPESARWCMEHGDLKRAAKIVGMLVPARKKELEGAVWQEVRHIERKKEEKLGYAALFSGPYIRRTILAGIPWGLMDVATYGVGIFTPIILASLAFSGDHLDLIAKDFKATEGAAFLDLFLIVGFALNIWLVDRLGRIRLQVIGFAGMALGLALLAAASLQQGAGQHSIFLVFAGFILFNVLMNAGPNATTFILPAELYPTKLRASGHGFAAACAKTGAVCGIFFLPIVKEALGTSGVLIILAGVSLLGLVVTLLFRVETAGRRLEELHPGEC